MRTRRRSFGGYRPKGKLNGGSGMPSPRRKTPKGAFATGKRRGWKNRMMKSGSTLKQVRRVQRKVRRKAGMSSYRPYRPKSMGGPRKRRKL